MNTKIKQTLCAAAVASLVGISSSAFATAPVTGTLTLVNNIQVVGADGGYGYTQTPVTYVVSDATGTCYQGTLAINGTATIPWSAAYVHAAPTTAAPAGKCTDITTVAMTTLKNPTLGYVVFNSGASALSATMITAATGAMTFTAPTTVHPVELLIFTASGSATTAGAAVWTAPLGVAATFSATTGALTGVGAPTATNLSSLEAEQYMKAHGIMPAGEAVPFVSKED